MKKIIIAFLVIGNYLAGNAQIIKKEIPDKLIVFTFDDATESQYSIVAPLLKEKGFHATFFVCEFPTSLPDRSAYMDWQQIKELDNLGFEIANHTKDHPNLTKISPDEVEYQLNYINNKCDSMHIPKPVSFAYPGYGLNSSIVDYVKKSGYKFARAGGDRPYNPLVDYPLLIPSWAMNSENKQQIMNAFKEARNGKIVVLTIHGVPDIEHPWVNTPPELFSEYLEYLYKNNYKVISLEDLEKYINTDEAIRVIKPEFN